MRIAPSLPDGRRRVAFILCLFAFLLAAGLCGAQDTADNGLMLWKATGPEGNGTAYLLGTIHEAPPDLYPLDRGYMAAFDAADRLVAEMDTTRIDSAAATRLTQELAMLPDGVTLREVIGPELWQSLLDSLAEFGIRTVSPDRLNVLQPLPVAFMLLTSSLSSVQVERGLGIEAFFLQRARQQDMPIGELEGLRYQLELFASIPLKLQTRYLAMILDHGRDKLGESYLSLADAWREGDLEAVAEIVRIERESDPSLEPFYAAILEGRNPAMADNVSEYVRQGGVTLVLVGAAHLYGELGILDLLKNRGFRIERMPALGRPDPKF